MYHCGVGESTTSPRLCQGKQRPRGANPLPKVRNFAIIRHFKGQYGGGGESRSASPQICLARGSMCSTSSRCKTTVSLHDGLYVYQFCGGVVKPVCTCRGTGCGQSAS